MYWIIKKKIFIIIYRYYILIFVIFYSYIDEVFFVFDLDSRILWGRKWWKIVIRLCFLRLGGGRFMLKRLFWGICYFWSFRVVWFKMIYKILKDFIC